MMWWQKATHERSVVNNSLPMKDTSAGAQSASDPCTYAIELHDVTKRFLTPTGNAYTAIRDINMAVAPGEFVAVVGPTGSELTGGDCHVDITDRGICLASWR